MLTAATIDQEEHRLIDDYTFLCVLIEAHRVVVGIAFAIIPPSLKNSIMLVFGKFTHTGASNANPCEEVTPSNLI